MRTLGEEEGNANLQNISSFCAKRKTKIYKGMKTEKSAATEK